MTSLLDEFERLTLNGELRFSIMASVTRCLQRVSVRGQSIEENMNWSIRTYFIRIIRFQLLYILFTTWLATCGCQSMSNVIFHTLQRYRAIWEFLIIRSWYLIISTFSEEKLTNIIIIGIFYSTFPTNYKLWQITFSCWQYYCYCLSTSIKLPISCCQHSQDGKQCDCDISAAFR